MDQSDTSQSVQADTIQDPPSKEKISGPLSMRTLVILGVLLLSFFCISTYVVFIYSNSKQPNSQRKVNKSRVIVPPLVEMGKYTTDLYSFEYPRREWSKWQENDRSGGIYDLGKPKLFFEIVGFRDTSISATDEDINFSKDDPRIESSESINKNGYNYLLTIWKKDTEIANQLQISDGKHLISMETSLDNLKGDSDENKILDTFRFTGLDLSHNWIEYTNPSLKVSFKYPNNASLVRDTGSHVEIRSESGEFIYIGVKNSQKNIASYKDCSGIPPEEYSDTGKCVELGQDIKVDGIVAKRFLYSCGIDCGFDVIQVDNPHLEFEFSTWAADFDAYETFLQTVRFIK